MFDSIRIVLNDSIVNWLTPVWILGVGALLGLILCALVWAVLWGLSRIPAIGLLNENRQAALITASLLGVLIFAFTLYSAWPTLVGGGAAPAGQAPAQGAAVSGVLDNALGLAGLAAGSWLAGLAVVALVSRRAVAETSSALTEGVLGPILGCAAVLALWGIVGVAFIRTPDELLASLFRAPALWTQGVLASDHKIPAPTELAEKQPFVPIPVSFRADEIREIRFFSDQRLKIATLDPTANAPNRLTLEITPGEPQKWRKVGAIGSPFRGNEVDTLFVQNLGIDAAALRVITSSSIAHPEMLSVPTVALSVLGVFLFYLFLRAAAPKMAAVALSTAKSEIAQPLYAFLLGLSIFALLVFVLVPYNTFGDDIKILKDSDLTLILVVCLFQAAWSASTSVADEIEGKTALTVLSKPVGRRDFILGKFIGIGWAVGLQLVILGLVMLITVAYKPVYENREGGQSSQTSRNVNDASYDPIADAKVAQDATWQLCFYEMNGAIPGLVLVFMEVLVMAAMSVAISTRLPWVPNLLICATIYVLGHLTPLLVQSQVVSDQLPPVIFLSQLIAAVFPVLDHFNVSASISAGREVPLVYLGWSLIYCLVYCTIAMLLALTLFEDRDLA